MTRSDRPHRYVAIPQPVSICGTRDLVMSMLESDARRAVVLDLVMFPVRALRSR